MDKFATLDEALSSAETPAAIPLPLPVAHMSVARWLESILSVGRLQPRECKVFGNSLLYLSYGGLFYRTSDRQTENATELPIALVFDPGTLARVSYYFPFDSGAMANKRFGVWSVKMEPFATKFRVAGRGDTSVPSRLVYHLFGDNERYIRGSVEPSCATKPNPFPLLSEFLSANLSDEGVDHRQRTIECVSSNEIKIDASLLWIGIPDCLTQHLYGLYSWTKPRVPEFFLYQYHRNFNPAQIGAQLEQAAAPVISRHLRLP